MRKVNLGLRAGLMFMACVVAALLTTWLKLSMGWGVLVGAVLGFTSQLIASALGGR